jgi:UDP-GlcNAc:undecaprenyl-phosphate GlcNAc-1-phosphate transferase
MWSTVFSLFPIALGGLISFLISYMVTPLCAIAARSLGIMDNPGSARKINLYPVPRLGGLGFFASYLISVLLTLKNPDPTASAILISGGAIIIFGIIDDRFSLPPLIKLSSQLLCAAIAILIIGAPDKISLLGFGTLTLSAPLGVILGMLRIAFTVNAVNFSDGLDGLAAGLSSVALLSLFIYSLSVWNTVTASSAFIIAMGVLGFLPHNKYRARIFMGDLGSQFLGLSIATLSLTAKEGSFNPLTSLFLAVPLLDTYLAVIRRLAKGKNPFKADRGHLHHLLVDGGLSHPASVKLLVSLSALVASVALLFITA